VIGTSNHREGSVEALKVILEYRHFRANRERRQRRRMSALGQKQTLGPRNAMSALPPKAYMVQRDGYVRFVPKADLLLHRPKPTASRCR
jgi:hypothetical protein